jgi:hypothetical protein
MIGIISSRCCLCDIEERTYHGELLVHGGE